MTDTISIIFTVVGASAAVVGVLATLILKRMDTQYKAGYNAHRLSTAEQLLKELPCSMHEEKLREHAAAVSSHEQSIRSIFFQMDLLLKVPKTAQSNSPLSLSDYGRKSAKDLDLYGKIMRNWLTIKSLIAENVQSDAPYDVQECCKMLVAAHSDKLFAQDELAEMKQYAYENASPLAEYLLAASIIMRDEYLKTIT